MSACWASRTARTGMAALLLGAALGSPAAARVHTRVTVDSGQVVRSVHINRHGITVLSPGEVVDLAKGGGITISDSAGMGDIIVDHGSGMVRLFSDATVKPGETVDGDVVAVFGSVHVAGHVTGSAVAVFGSIDLAPGSSVEDDAVAVGGGVLDNPGARIGGQSVSVGFLPLTLGLPGLPVLLGFIALGWLVSVFFGWVFAALFPERLARIAVMSSRRTTASLLLGLVSGPLVPVLAVLLMVTVIGLPVGAMLPFVFVAIVYAGQLSSLHVLGAKLLRRPLGERPGIGPVVAGSTLMAAFFAIGAILWGTPGSVRTVGVFFDLVGAVMLAALSCIGTGAFLLSRAGSLPADVGGAPAAPAAEPPAAPRVAEGPLVG